jgi:heat shock protein HslJ
MSERHWAWRAVGVAAVLSAVATMSACGDDDDDDGEDAVAVPTSAELDGNTFSSTDVEGQELVEDSQITLSFEDGRVAAQAGCNSMNGAYTIADGTLAIQDELVQTLMACEEPLMAQDAWLAGFLTSGPAISLADGVLTLTGDDVTITADEQA